jgi:ATP-dependent Clp protease ATP-binding subunit ClpA
MPSLTATLEDAIHRAIGFANARRHELATLEHLLLALVDEPDAARVMRACSVDLGELRANLTRFIDTELETLVFDSDGSEAAPSTGFQRVIQRAAIHVQSSGRSEVTGANVLVAIFNERESHAAFFLQEQDMTRYDAVNYLSHGVAKDPASARPDRCAAPRIRNRRRRPAARTARRRKPASASSASISTPRPSTVVSTR